MTGAQFYSLTLGGALALETMRGRKYVRQASQVGRRHDLVGDLKLATLAHQCCPFSRFGASAASNEDAFPTVPPSALVGLDFKSTGIIGWSLGERPSGHRAGELVR
jgi:hypothetical protein